MKNNIAIVLHDFNAGGTEAIALRLAREWVDAGRSVTIIAGAADGAMRTRVPDGVKVEILNPAIRRSCFSRFRLGAAMLPVIARTGADVVFIPGNYHFFLARTIRKHFPDLALIAKVSNPLLPPLPRVLRLLARSVLRPWLAAPDRLVFMSEALLEADRDLVPNQFLDVIAEPNLPKQFVPLPRRRPPGPQLVLAIGRMEPQKNLPLAIRAFAELKKRREVRLQILGEGKQRGELEALTRRLGIVDAVDMPGFVSDVPERLSTAALLLMTSRYEGFPAALVEALASDVPVVSTDCSPTQKALIRNAVCGIVVDDSNPKALADAMEKVLDGPFSSEMDRTRGLEKYRANVSAAAWLALFDSVCRRASR